MYDCLSDLWEKGVDQTGDEELGSYLFRHFSNARLVQDGIAYALYQIIFIVEYNKELFGMSDQSFRRLEEWSFFHGLLPESCWPGYAWRDGGRKTRGKNPCRLAGRRERNRIEGWLLDGLELGEAVYVHSGPFAGNETVVDLCFLPRRTGVIY